MKKLKSYKMLNKNVVCKIISDR